MPVKHIERAYAKINPYLSVTGRREDGYHTILSHMQAVTLCDTLDMTWEQDEAGEVIVRLTCDDPRLPCDDTNLVVRAAKALLFSVGASGSLTVNLQKCIPMAAGLAGGSADAAATLRGLNTLLGTPLTIEELCQIGAKLGADIPFCLRCTEMPAMTARGIGEILTPALPLPGHAYLVIACEGEGVSTPWAYRRLDEVGLATCEEAERAYAAFGEALAAGELTGIGHEAYNCFEDVVLPERPVAVSLLAEMAAGGAVFALMSGSGPSVVGYFEDENTAASCVAQLAKKGVVAHLCRPLN
jgi:4-diphosphocytidyl-2-C-methyl-D-erythritol kinase